MKPKTHHLIRRKASPMRFALVKLLRILTLPLFKLLRILTLPLFKLLMIVLDIYQHFADSYNLRQAGYRRAPFGQYTWHNPNWKAKGLPSDLTLFPSRSLALEHMNDQIINAAVMEAIRSQRTNFSGRSRNSSCPCGSGKKFKVCCMIPD